MTYCYLSFYSLTVYFQTLVVFALFLEKLSPSQPRQSLYYICLLGCGNEKNTDQHLLLTVHGPHCFWMTDWYVFLCLTYVKSQILHHGPVENLLDPFVHSISSLAHFEL